jgi:hypothetical protein
MIHADIMETIETSVPPAETKETTKGSYKAEELDSVEVTDTVNKKAAAVQSVYSEAEEEEERERLAAEFSDTSRNIRQDILKVLSIIGIVGLGFGAVQLFLRSNCTLTGRRKMLPMVTQMAGSHFRTTTPAADCMTPAHPHNSAPLGTCCSVGIACVAFGIACVAFATR